jgi:preprotein translocase subunit SecB
MSEQQEIQVALQRIYVKDLSFESPHAVETFGQQWKPQVNVEMQTRNRKLADSVYEVSLEMTITTSNTDKPAFVIEVEQAGIFTIKGIDGEPLRRLMGTFCLNILFPYLRETVDSLCLKGSFPPLILAPINFDQLYEQSTRQQQNQAGAQQPNA